MGVYPSGLNAGIILQGKQTPVENPVQMAEGVARVRQLQAQAALAPIQYQQAGANLQQTQLQNQENAEKVRQQQEDQQGNQLIQHQLADNNGDWTKVRPIVAGQVSDRVLRQRDADHVAYTSALLHATQEQRINENQKSMQLGQMIQSVIDAPDDQKQTVWSAQKQSAEAAGLIKPGMYSDTVPDTNTLKGYLGGTMYAATAAKIAMEKAQSDRAAAYATRQAQLAKTLNIGEKKQQAAQEYLNVTNPEEHAAWLEKWGNDEDVGDIYQNYKTYSPKNTDLITEQAMNAKDRMSATDRQARAKIYAQRVATAGPSALAATATDPNNPPEIQKAAKDALTLLQTNKSATLTPNALAIQRRDAERDQANLTKLQQQEAEQWGLVKRYENAVRGGAETVKDPKTGRDMSRDDAQAAADAARQKANDINKGGLEIMKRRQWGDYAPVAAPAPVAAAPAPQQSAPTPGPSTPAPSRGPVTPPATMLKEGVRTTFKNGLGVWTLKNGQPVQVGQ